MFWFDETRISLELRVRRLETDVNWAEEPPSGPAHALQTLISRLRRALTPTDAARGVVVQVAGNPFPLGSGARAFPLQGAYISWPKDLSPTYYNQWNLTVQQQIGQDWLASAGYVGNSVIHLWGNIQLNPAIYEPGATLATVALMTGQWLILPIIAIIPVAEAASVIIQVAYFKLTKRLTGEGKRIFRRSPLHYHFEMGGWSETQVVQRLWLVGILASMVGIALALL